MVLPPGTIVNPVPPAATSGKHPMAQRIADLLIQAFAQIAPERSAAASCGSTCNYTIVYDGDEIQYEMMGGGFGARATKDGIDAIQVNMSKCVGLQAEEAEAAYPVIIERFELVSDSGGAGRQRGGLGLRRDVKVETAAVLSISVRYRANGATRGTWRRFRPAGPQVSKSGPAGRTATQRQGGGTFVSRRAMWSPSSRQVPEASVRHLSVTRRGYCSTCWTARSPRRLRGVPIAWSSMRRLRP